MVVRTILDWIPDDLRSAMVVADAGDMRIAADICEAILGDDRASSVLRTRVLTLLGTDLSFEPARSGALRRRAVKSAQDPRLAKADQDWYSMLPETELEELILWLILLGVAVARIEWTEIDPATGLRVARIRNGRNVPTLRVWPARCLRFDVYGTKKWYARLDDGSEVEVKPGDGEWVLLTLGGRRPWARGLWRGLGALWLLKYFAIADMASASEKFAKGVLAAIAPPGSTPEDRDKLSEDLRDMGRDGVIAMPDGYDLKVVQLQANFEDIYLKQIDLANRSMAITTVGSDLPTESKGGVGTGAMLQGQVRQDYLEADASRAETDLRAQVLCPWADINFGDADLAPWPVYNVQPPEDLSRIATTWKTVGDFIRVARENNDPIDVVAVYQRFDIPIDPTAPESLPPIFAYHIAAGIPRKNEVRARLKLSPVSDADGGNSFTTAPSNNAQGAQAA